MINAVLAMRALCQKMNRGVAVILFALVLCVGLTAPVGADQNVLTGVAVKIHDGDTLTLTGGAKIRIFGIDAPELRQRCEKDNVCVPCGEQAREVLKELAKGDLVCEARGKSYDRTVARCTSGGVDIALAMVEAGQAVVYGKYLKKRDPIRAEYLDAEAGAKKSAKGIWGEIFIPPDQWRHRRARLECER